MPTEHTWTPVENIRQSVHVWAYSENCFHILQYNKLCMWQEEKQHTLFSLHCNRQLANVGYIAIKPVDLVIRRADCSISKVTTKLASH